MDGRVSPVVVASLLVGLGADEERVAAASVLVARREIVTLPLAADEQVEIQIRSRAMHARAEHGAASHLGYREWCQSPARSACAGPNSCDRNGAVAG